MASLFTDRRSVPRSCRLFAGITIALALVTGLGEAARASSLSARGPSSAEVLAELQPKMVKIHGVGGLRGMESYQSGFLISDKGHVLTAWSHVLDTDFPMVVLQDGRRFDAELIGADPRLEIALLKIDAADLPHFDLARAVEAAPGTRVLALSNLFGVATGNEPLSAQHGVVSIKTPLAARRGVFETPYDGPVYVLDAVTNNPGAAGGALVTLRGRLVGILGKELRNTSNHTWLNYAVPIEEIRSSVDRLLAGKPVDELERPTSRPVRPIAFDELGIVLVPEVLPRTPPYVDFVRPGSPAARAGLRPDDLVVLVNDRLTQSCKMLREELESMDRETAVRVSVMRGTELVEVTFAVSKP